MIVGVSNFIFVLSGRLSDVMNQQLIRCLVVRLPSLDGLSCRFITTIGQL